LKIQEEKPVFDHDFPKADPVPRGCGEREPGGIYAECGLSPRGRPLEEFLIDPPLPVPEGLDLVNKPMLWQRTLASGEPALDKDGQPIYDLLILVGQEHYPYVPDFLEECLPPDELIATGRGLVPIEEVQEGDMVLTHLGHLRAVTSTIARPYAGTLLSIETPYWHLPLRLTPEHPVLRARIIPGRKLRKLDGPYSEHVTERGFVPARELHVGDYLCFPIQREEVDVETVTMSYTKEYGAFRNSTRTSEKVAQAQALRVAQQDVPLLRKQRRLLEQLASRQQWTLDEVREACSHLYRHDSGLARALAQLCEKEFLVRVDRACYRVTDKGQRAAAEPYMSFAQLGRLLGMGRVTAQRLVNPPDRRHVMHIEVPVDGELMRLIGYYLAEGSVANTTQNEKAGYYNVVELSFGLLEDREEQRLAEDACRIAQKLGFGANVYIKQGYWHVAINSRHLAHWLIEEFGSGARHKIIPPWVIALPPVKVRPLLEAYLAGDGYIRGYQRTGTTASLQLAYAIAQIANRIGWRASITKSMQGFHKQAVDMSHQSPLRAIYHVTCYEKTGTKVFSDGEYLYLPIRSITHVDYAGTVHNLSVAGDESYCVGYHAVHNCRRFGASRRLNPNLDLSLLSRASRMILAHPHALNLRWQEQRPPDKCKKPVPGHDVATSQRAALEEEASAGGLAGERATTTALMPLPADAVIEAAKPLTDTPISPPQSGPCLYKLWNLIPREAAQTVIEAVEGESGGQHAGVAALPLCLREIGSTIYQYHPTGESADGLVPGLFAALPITGFALVRYQDGSVNEQAKAKILAGVEAHEQHALPFYETDR
jgi:intein/homing endonuclease